MIRILSFATIAMLSFAACSAPPESSAGVDTSLDGTFDRAPLIIETDDGVQHEINVYLATEYEQQRRGLMFVRQMPEDVGMLFIYEDSDIHSMWMKNTFISLDLVFARADGSVSSVIHDAQPLSLQSLGSIEPVSYVLELNAGTARRLSIGRGSRLIIDATRD
jgi:uncharacterized membrane protein (UPF0127 family)